MQSSRAIVNGVLYIESADRIVYAFNATTGAKLWNHTTLGPVESSPAVTSGAVYVGSDDGFLYALNATTGTSSGSAMCPTRRCNLLPLGQRYSLSREQ